MDLPLIISPGYDWLTYEPDGHLAPYGDVEDSVAFVLAPVRAWSARLRLELRTDMEQSIYKWVDFIGDGPGREQITLIRQAAELAVRGVPKYEVGANFYPDSPYDYDASNREYPFMVLRPDRVERGLDWLLYAFSYRFRNRAQHIAAEEGTTGLRLFCEAIVSRFDVHEQWTPAKVGHLTAGERSELRAPTPKGLSSEAELEFHMAKVLKSVARSRHELWPVMENAALKGEKPADWNGWEDRAWLCFVEQVDKTQRALGEDAREADARLGSKQSPTVQPNAGGSSISGYFAPEYADRLREAFEKDPELYLRRSKFTLLHEAANLSERQVRTVKEQVGYTRENARGFSHFIRLLYEADGRTAPIPLPKS